MLAGETFHRATAGLLWFALRVKIHRFQPIGVSEIHRLAFLSVSALNRTLRLGRRKCASQSKALSPAACSMSPLIHLFKLPPDFLINCALGIVGRIVMVSCTHGL